MAPGPVDRLPEGREPLLLTRLSPPPPPPDAVLRPRLLSLLDGVWANRLTFITAPPGYGKSVLLAQWLESGWAADRSWAYIALTPSEMETAAFINYLAAAFAGVAAELGRTTGELLDLEPRPGIPTLLNPLINDIVRFDKPVALVLDDVHVIADAPAADAVRYLLSHGPPDLHILLAGRTTADFRDATLLLDKGGHHLSAESLAFTLPEIERFFAEQPDCRMASDDLPEIFRRTEGWPAGLRLVLLACRDQNESWRTMLADDRVLKELLFNQVVQRLDGETRRLLMAAALPRKFTGALLAEMTQADPAQVVDKLRSAALCFGIICRRSMRPSGRRSCGPITCAPGSGSPAAGSTHRRSNISPRPRIMVPSGRLSSCRAKCSPCEVKRRSSGRGVNSCRSRSVRPTLCSGCGMPGRSF